MEVTLAASATREPLYAWIISWTGNSLMSGGPCGWIPAAAIPFGDSRREGVEVLARLPEVDDAPTSVDRAGRVEEEPFGGVRSG